MKMWNCPLGIQEDLIVHARALLHIEVAIEIAVEPPMQNRAGRIKDTYVGLQGTAHSNHYL